MLASVHHFLQGRYGCAKVVEFFQFFQSVSSDGDAVFRRAVYEVLVMAAYRDVVFRPLDVGLSVVEAGELGITIGQSSVFCHAFRAIASMCHANKPYRDYDGRVVLGFIILKTGQE